MFKFFPSEEDKDKQKEVSLEKAVFKAPFEESHVHEKHYALYRKNIFSEIKITVGKSAFTVNTISISKLSEDELVRDDTKVKEILTSVSDLIPGSYEGMLHFASFFVNIFPKNAYV